LYLCLWNTKKYSKTLVGAPIEFEITQHTKNEEDMELQLERGQKLYFQKLGLNRGTLNESCLLSFANKIRVIENSTRQDSNRTALGIPLSHSAPTSHRL
jgi:hypothetical protein